MRRAGVLAVILLALGLPLGTSSCGGCPAALLEGELVAIDATTPGVRPDFGPVLRVDVPPGYDVRRNGERLAIAHLIGGVIAVEGDRVAIGGGMAPGSDDTWRGCGEIHRAGAGS